MYSAVINAAMAAPPQKTIPAAGLSAAVNMMASLLKKPDVSGNAARATDPTNILTNGIGSFRHSPPILNMSCS